MTLKETIFAKKNPNKLPYSFIARIVFNEILFKMSKFTFKCLKTDQKLILEHKHFYSNFIASLHLPIFYQISKFQHHLPYHQSVSQGLTLFKREKLCEI